MRRSNLISSCGIASGYRSAVPTFVVFVAFALPSSAVGATVAVIGGDAQAWCDLLETDGHLCVTFPGTGPDAPLTPFDVVIDLSWEWSDPDGLLAQHMRRGKGVIVATTAWALGINSNPTVQAWIGANEALGGSGRYTSTTTDPILGDTPPGTQLGDCFDFACTGLRDTSGHPSAKVLAVFPFPVDSIAILRNSWQGGQSVFFTTWVDPVYGTGPELILNAVRELSLPPPIPTVSTWGALILALAVMTAGSVIIPRRHGLARLVRCAH